MVAKRTKVSESIPQTENKIAKGVVRKSFSFRGIHGLVQMNGGMKVS